MNLYELLIIIEVLLPVNDGDILDVEDVDADDTFADSAELGQDSC